MKPKNTICLWFDKDAHEADALGAQRRAYPGGRGERGRAMRVTARGAGERHAWVRITWPRWQRVAASVLLRGVGRIRNVGCVHRLVVAKRHPHHQTDKRKLE